MVNLETVVMSGIVLMIVFVGMRVLYGCWPWEGHKTWYATRRLLPSVEQEEPKKKVMLPPQQIKEIQQSSLVAVAAGDAMRRAAPAEAESFELKVFDGGKSAVEPPPNQSLPLNPFPLQFEPLSQEEKDRFWESEGTKQQGVK